MALNNLELIVHHAENHAADTTRLHIVHTVAYTSETWVTSVKCIKKLNAFQQRCLRWILGARYTNRATNSEVPNRSGSNRLSTVIAQRRLLIAHVNLLFPRVPMSSIPEGGSRAPGRPRNTWRRAFGKNLQLLNTSRNEDEEHAQDRHQWRSFTARYAQQHGKN